MACTIVRAYRPTTRRGISHSPVAPIRRLRVARALRPRPPHRVVVLQLPAQQAEDLLHRHVPVDVVLDDERRGHLVLDDVAPGIGVRAPDAEPEEGVRVGCVGDGVREGAGFGVDAGDLDLESGG